MKALIIEDDQGIIEAVTLCFRLRWTEMEVVSASEGSKGLELLEKERPDIVILDIGLPDMDGFQVIKQIREFSQVPVIMLTVRDKDIEIAKGLEMGADDYIPKPFSHIELVARVQAVMRRAQGISVNQQRPIVAGKLTIDFASNEVKLNGKSTKLTSTEHQLLNHLVNSEGRMLTHEFLLTKVWGETYQDARDLLRVHIQHLRQKLGDSSDVPRIIVTEHGMGYKFVRPLS